MGGILGALFGGGGSTASSQTSAFGAAGGNGINSPTQTIEIQGGGKKSNVNVTVTDQNALKIASQELQRAEKLMQSPTHVVAQYTLIIVVLYVTAKHFKWV